jgi:CDGSH-type Zn-finger protein/ferredoxin
MSNKLTPFPNGPIKLDVCNGVLEKDGQPVAGKDPGALCVCGESRNKPYCDGSHNAAGFSSEREIQEETIQEYQGKEVTITFNRSICSGAGKCVQGLGTVFKSGDSSNWIFPDNDTAENIIAQVKACPSGALSCQVGDEVTIDERTAQKVTIVKNGPYHVEGIEMETENRPTRGSSSKFSLCRCGKSRNKPYCDYSHAEQG